MLVTQQVSRGLWWLLQVGDATIKLQLGRDARWTKALKLLLVCLKWCTAWAVEHPAALGRQ